MGEGMSKLENTFSWSFSSALDFDECQRKRYWKKYGKWGGWSRDATPRQKKAYQLDKMQNFYSLLGQSVERAIMHMLREHQNGNECNTESAYTKIAKPFLNNAWSQSKSGRWRDDPKRYTCLREHYYKSLPTEEERKLTREMIKQIKRCIDNFKENTLPRIGNVGKDMELPVNSPETRGDAEHFVHEGIKIYAIPDYAYRCDDAIHIHDWKAGKRKPSHREQLAVYGLWAKTKHARNDEDIYAYVEYLNEGQFLVNEITQDDLQRASERIDQSVSEMTEMLVDCDRKSNRPLPKEEWQVSLDPNICRHCNFLELCEPELREIGLL